MQISVCLNDNCVRISVHMCLHTQLARMETTATYLNVGIFCLVCGSVFFGGRAQSLREFLIEM